MLGFDTATFMLSVLFSVIGTGYFIYGRKQSKFVPLAVGIVLGIFPYFISNMVAMFFIGAGLIALPILFRE